MLPHYSPLKVAESFTILAALFPGRIDLGLGRASGTDPMTTYALQRDRRQASPDDFPQQLAELLAYFEDDLPADHPFRQPRQRSPACPSCRCRGCSAPRSRARSGPASSACPTRSPTSSTRPARRSPRPTASASRPYGRCKPQRTAVAAWVLCAADRRGGGVPGVVEPDGDDDAATRPPAPSPRLSARSSS